MSVRRTQASAAAAAFQRRLAAEEGFGIIEVVVSALVVILVSIGVFAAIDAAGRTADSNKSRSAASALAQADQERMRSMTISDLIANSDKTRTDAVDGESYTVRSQASYVIDPADANVTSCTSSERNPRYLKLTSTVSWPAMRGTSPVQQDTLRAIPTGSLKGLGSLAVGIQDRNAVGVAGVSVSISGPQSYSGTTNANGCVIFGYVNSGTYTVTFSKSGYVEPTYPNRATVTDSAVVAEDSMASKSYVYDRAGAVNVAYQTTTYGTSTTSSTTGDAFTVSNSGMGSVSSRIFPLALASTATSGKVLFPFTSAYQVWSGGCEENAPPSGQTVTVPAGGTSSTVNLREPRLRVKVQRRTTSSTFSTTNYGTMPNDGRTTVKFSSATPGCVSDTNGTWVSDTTGTGTASSTYSTWEAILPYGTYSVCIAYNASTTQRARNTASGIVSSTPTGSTYGTTITVPFSSNPYAC